jgi:hypothetical protein
MQSKGDLLRMKVHAHNSIFDEVCSLAICFSCSLWAVFECH